MGRIIIFFVILFFQTSYCQLTVKQAIDLALENNLYLKSYSIVPELEKFDIQTAGYRPNFILNNQSIFLVKQENLNAIKPNEELFLSMYANQLWFQATKPLQLGGKRKSKMAVQTQEYEQSKLDLLRFKNDLAYKVALKWLDVWYCDELLQNYQIAKINIDSIFEANEIRMKKNEISSTDVSRTLILSERYATQVNLAWQNLQTESQKFEVILGIKYDSIDYESNYFFKQIIFSDSLNQKNAFTYRIDYKSILQDKNINISNLKLQKAMALPNLEAGIIANPQNTQPYMGWYFQMPIPLLDRNKANISKSKLQILKSEFDQKALEQEINSQVKYSYQEYLIYKANFERYIEIRKNSQIILGDVKDNYLKGKTTLVDYLNAKQSWNETEQEYDLVDYKYRKSYLDLLYITGQILD